MLNLNYNYIISGSGCAGLSLLYRMMQHSFFANKQILVIDKTEKNVNDHTWCFWEKEAGVFDSIVHHKWKQLDFYSNNFSARFDIVPYEYKMIRSIDLYDHVLDKAKQQSNIHFVYGHVQSISNVGNKAVVVIDDKQFTAEYVFNSIFFKEEFHPPLKSKKKVYSLLQHFKGWLIETHNNVFDQRVATFMDFRVSQQHGTAFVYVLPVASNKALVEYTLFTKELLDKKEYDIALADYIKNMPGIHNYSIKEKEFGVIPMTNKPFLKGDGNIINIGTAGGQTKPSSGFTFHFIQKHSDKIINALIAQRDPHVTNSIFLKRFNIYDRTLLNILYNQKLGGDEIFTDLFKKNPVQRVFRFLDNETNLVEELKLVNTTRTSVFLPATVHELLR